jgi:hypothetical protein
MKKSLLHELWPIIKTPDQSFQPMDENSTALFYLRKAASIFTI